MRCQADRKLERNPFEKYIKECMPMSIQETLENLGLQVWGKDIGKPRIYIESDEHLRLVFGLDIERYKTGNIKNASVNGSKISNGKAHKILSKKIYFDCISETFVGINKEYQRVIGVQQ